MKMAIWVKSASFNQTSPIPSFVRRGAGGGRRTLPKHASFKRAESFQELTSIDDEIEDDPGWELLLSIRSPQSPPY